MDRILLHGKSYVTKSERKDTCSKEILMCSALQNLMLKKQNKEISGDADHIFECGLAFYCHEYLALSKFK